jgi:uncharacterized protein DUF3108
MHRLRNPLFVMVAVGVLAFVATAAATSQPSAASYAKSWPTPKSDMLHSGKNPYFPLEPGYQLVLKGGGEELTLTVLDETKTIDGVATRVVEEYERANGKLSEIALNYYTLAKGTDDVFNFGEDCEAYKNGKVSSRGGSWHSGVNKAMYGMMMPGKPAVGTRHYQEQAPGVAMDRAEIVSVHETVVTPAGTFKDCVKVRETSGMSPSAPAEHRWYAPGIGLVKFEEMELVQYGPGGKSMRKKGNS